ALGIGLGIGGFGAAVDTNFVDNITRAYIADDVLGAHPIFAGNGVEVSALSREGFSTTAIGIGAGLFAGVAGAASAIKSDSTTEAFIRNADVDAIMNIEVDADSAVHMLFVDGAVAAGAVGSGGSVGVGLFKGETKAYVEGSTLDASGDIVVTAESTEETLVIITTASVGIGALAGAVSVMDFSSSTDAYITDSTASADQDVIVSANNTTQVNQDPNTSDAIIFVTGTASVGGVGAGASVDVITVKNNVNAYIGDDSTITAGRHVHVLASTDRDINSTVIAFSGGLVAGISGAITVISVGTGLDADGNEGASPAQGAIDGAFLGGANYRSDKGFALVNADETVDVSEGHTAGGVVGERYKYIGPVTTSFGTPLDLSAEDFTVTANWESLGDPSQIVATVDGLNTDPDDPLAGNAQTTGNNSLVTTTISPDAGLPGSTRAYIGDNVTVTAGTTDADGDILVQAIDVLDIGVTTGAVSISLFGVSVGGSIAIVNIGGQTEAFVGSNSTLSAADDITVKAKLTANATILAVGGSAGLVGALGAQVGVVNDTASQNAYTDDGTSDADGTKIIKADEVNITAEAVRDYEVKPKGVSIGSVAAGASIGTINIGGETNAYLGQFTQVGQSTTTVNDVFVTASSKVTAKVDNLTIAAGIAAGAGNDGHDIARVKTILHEKQTAS
ncbi:MAG: beta strand repeat-containing protein, partial [Lysobacterales bacterium]